MLLLLFVTSLAVVSTAATGREQCATPDGPGELQRHMTDRVMELSRREPKSFTVDTYVHVITTEARQNDYPKAMVERQVEVMNDKYAPYLFQFRTKGIDYTVNDTWAAGGVGHPELGEEEARKLLQEAHLEFMSELSKGTYSTLNLFLLSDLQEATGGVLGFAKFPMTHPGTKDLLLDGIVIDADTIPGGDSRNHTGGATAVHETGHWLGLYHVFQQGLDGDMNLDDANDSIDVDRPKTCDRVGDYVFDTPAQRTPTKGCPKEKNSCPEQPGKDSVHNYMDYSSDECMTEFTPGQTMRMANMFSLYREGK